MEELREIQMAWELPVQSHLSENPGEIEFVRSLLHPPATHVAAAVGAGGLPGP